jgi:hypothetical protein
MAPRLETCKLTSIITKVIAVYTVAVVDQFAAFLSVFLVLSYTAGTPPVRSVFEVVVMAIQDPAIADSLASERSCS